jgi:hypothetical protein
MPNLPPAIVSLLSIFKPLFSKPVYQKFSSLFQAHILSKGVRTVTELLKLLSLRDAKNFSIYHDFFNKNKWSSLAGAKILFQKISSLFPKNEEIHIVLDTTVERRKGAKIKSLNIQRDAVRSTKSRKVLVPGLLWLVCTVQIKLPGTHKTWALPFLSVLIPPERPLSSSKNKKDNQKKPKKHKTLNDWTSQIAKLIRKWAGKDRKISIAADSAFATYILANTCIDNKINLTSRMRLDARIFQFPVANKKGRINLTGLRMPTFNEMLSDLSLKWQKMKVDWYKGQKKTIESISGTSLWYGYGIRPVPIKWVLIKGAEDSEPTVLFALDPESSIEKIIQDYINRWSIEVTFEELRRHLGMETQRQWSDNAIERETPCIIASFSIIVLIALELQEEESDKITIQTSSWYPKKHITFSDMLAYVRRHILKEKYFPQFGKNEDLWSNKFSEIMNQMAAA